MSNPARVLWEFATPDLRLGRLVRTYLALWAVVGLLAAGWLAWRRVPAEAWLCGSTVIMALTAGTLVSMPRFVATNPVFLLAIADLVECVQRPALRLGIFLAFSTVQILCVLAWYQQTMFGSDSGLVKVLLKSCSIACNVRVIVALCNRTGLWCYITIPCLVGEH